MAESDVCAQALRAGLTPPAIASQQGISLSSVLAHLDHAVGENKLSRSEIYFAIPSEVRARVELACQTIGYRPESRTRPVALGPVARFLADEDPNDVQVCLRYGPASRYYGDLYELVRKYEIDMHSLVRDVLVEHFGEEERAWWYRGVPLRVRQGCVERAEELGRFDLDPWSCTYLMDLGVVIGQQWTLFAKSFKASNKNDVVAQVRDVNDVRNRVMHPVRDAPPTDLDFDVLGAAYQYLQVVRGRFYGEEAAALSRAR